MDALRRKIVACAVCLSIALSALFVLTTERFFRTFTQLRWILRNRVDPARILRFDPDFVLTLALFVVLTLLVLALALRFVSLLRRIIRAERASSAVPQAARPAAECGADKYIRQLDEYLKNGIIDRAEYGLLRERYLRMQGDRRVR